LNNVTQTSFNVRIVILILSYFWRRSSVTW